MQYKILLETECEPISLIPQEFAKLLNNSSMGDRIVSVVIYPEHFKGIPAQTLRTTVSEWNNYATFLMHVLFSDVLINE